MQLTLFKFFFRYRFCFALIFRLLQNCFALFEWCFCFRLVECSIFMLQTSTEINRQFFIFSFFTWFFPLVFSSMHCEEKNMNSQFVFRVRCFCLYYSARGEMQMFERKPNLNKFSFFLWTNERMKYWNFFPFSYFHFIRKFAFSPSARVFSFNSENQISFSMVSMCN